MRCVSEKRRSNLARCQFFTTGDRLKVNWYSSSFRNNSTASSWQVRELLQNKADQIRDSWNCTSTHDIWNILATSQLQCEHRMTDMDDFSIHLYYLEFTFIYPKIQNKITITNYKDYCFQQTENIIWSYTKRKIGNWFAKKKCTASSHPFQTDDFIRVKKGIHETFGSLVAESSSSTNANVTWQIVTRNVTVERSLDHLLSLQTVRRFVTATCTFKPT